MKYKVLLGLLIMIFMVSSVFAAVCLTYEGIRADAQANLMYRNNFEDLLPEQRESVQDILRKPSTEEKKILEELMQAIYKEAIKKRYFEINPIIMNSYLNTLKTSKDIEATFNRLKGLEYDEFGENVKRDEFLNKVTKLIKIEGVFLDDQIKGDVFEEVDSEEVRAKILTLEEEVALDIITEEIETGIESESLEADVEKGQLVVLEDEDAIREFIAEQEQFVEDLKFEIQEFFDDNALALINYETDLLELNQKYSDELEPEQEGFMARTYRKIRGYFKGEDLIDLRAPKIEKEDIDKAKEEWEFISERITDNEIKELRMEKAAEVYNLVAVYGALFDNDPEIRMRAIEVLRKYGDEASTVWLLNSLHDESEQVVSKALSAIQAINDPRAIPWVFKLFETEKSLPEGIIVNALKYLANQGEVSIIPAIEDLLKQDINPNAKYHLSNALVKLKYPEYAEVIGTFGILEDDIKVLKELEDIKTRDKALDEILKWEPNKALNPLIAARIAGPTLTKIGVSEKWADSSRALKVLERIFDKEFEEESLALMDSYPALSRYTEERENEMINFIRNEEYAKTVAEYLGRNIMSAPLDWSIQYDLHNILIKLSRPEPYEILKDNKFYIRKNEKTKRLEELKNIRDEFIANQELSEEASRIGNDNGAIDRILEKENAGRILETALENAEEDSARASIRIAMIEVANRGIEKAAEKVAREQAYRANYIDYDSPWGYEVAMSVKENAEMAGVSYKQYIESAIESTEQRRKKDILEEMNPLKSESEGMQKAMIEEREDLELQKEIEALAGSSIPVFPSLRRAEIGLRAYVEEGRYMGAFLADGEGIKTYIAKDADSRTKEVVYIHELLHNVIDASGIDLGTIDEEVLVTGLLLRMKGELDTIEDEFARIDIELTLSEFDNELEIIGIDDKLKTLLTGKVEDPSLELYEAASSIYGDKIDPAVNYVNFYNEDGSETDLLFSLQEKGASFATKDISEADVKVERKEAIFTEPTLEDTDISGNEDEIINNILSTNLLLGTDLDTAETAILRVAHLYGVDKENVKQTVSNFKESSSKIDVNELGKTNELFEDLASKWEKEFPIENEELKLRWKIFIVQTYEEKALTEKTRNILGKEISRLSEAVATNDLDSEQEEPQTLSDIVDDVPMMTPEIEQWYNGLEEVSPEVEERALTLEEEAVDKVFSETVEKPTLPMLKKEQEIRKIGLSSEQIDLINDNSGGLMTVYDYIGALRSGMGECQGVGLGLSEGTYFKLTELGGHRQWRDAYNMLLGVWGDSPEEKTPEFMDKLTAKADQIPIAFFLPTDIFTHDKAGATAKELQWLLDNPERMENVHFIVGGNEPGLEDYLTKYEGETLNLNYDIMKDIILNAPRAPKISIVIPAYKEGHDTLGRLLGTLSRQKGIDQRDMEIVVSIGSSVNKELDQGYTIAKYYQNKGMNIKIEFHEPADPSGQRNYGGRAATSELLLFLDADVSINDEFVAKGLAEFKEKDLDVAGTYADLSNSEFNIVDKTLWGMTNVVLRASQHVNPQANGQTIFVKKRIFEDVAGFDEEQKFAEDLKFASDAAKGNNFKMLNSIKTGLSPRRFEQNRYLTYAGAITASIYNFFGGQIKQVPWWYQFGQYDDRVEEIDEEEEEILTFVKRFGSSEKDIKSAFEEFREVHGMITSEPNQAQLIDAEATINTYGVTWEKAAFFEDYELDTRWKLFIGDKIRKRIASEAVARGDFSNVPELMAGAEGEVGVEGKEVTFEEVFEEEVSQEVQKRVDELIEQLVETDYAVREGVIKALEKIGEPAVKQLIKTLKDEDSMVRSNAAKALGGIGDKRAVKPLMEMLKDERYLVRYSTALALGVIGDERAVEPLIEILKDEDAVWLAAVEALGNIRNERAVKPLIEMLKDEDLRVRSKVAEALGRIGDKRAVEPLIEMLKDGNSKVRWRALESLVIMGKPAVEPLIKALKNKNHLIREGAAEILGKFKDERAVEPLIRALKDENPKVRETAVEALEGIINKITALVNALKDPEFGDEKETLIGLIEEDLETVVARKGSIETLDTLISRDIPSSLLRRVVYYKSLVEGEILSDEYLEPYDLSMDKDFPQAVSLEEILKHTDDEKPKKLLVVHNIRDGQGDELIRMIPLTQALVDKFPKLDVTIYTNREFLYEETGGVHIRNIQTLDDKVLPKEHDFDIIINHQYDSEEYSEKIEAIVQEADKAVVFLKTDKVNDNFEIRSFDIQGKQFEIGKGPSVYTPVTKLSELLGLPLRIGAREPKGRNILLGEGSAEADKWFEDNVNVKNLENREVVFFNGYGGESKSKGYSEPESMAQDIGALVEENDFVIIFPNDNEWGTFERAQEVFNLLTPEQKKNVVVSPGPGGKELDGAGDMIKHWVATSDHVVTVEGGMMHLAYNLGKEFTVVLKSGAGAPKWIPQLRTGEQSVVGVEGTTEDVVRGVRRGEVESLSQQVARGDFSNVPELTAGAEGEVASVQRGGDIVGLEDVFKDIELVIFAYGDQIFNIKPGVSINIGRDPGANGIVIPDKEISRRHAQIIRAEDGKLYIEDLKSTNGVYVDGEKIQGRVEINLKTDLITLGKNIILNSPKETYKVEELSEDEQLRWQNPARRPKIRTEHQQTFNGKTLTVEVLAQNNLLPRFGITINNKKVLISSTPYLISGRPAVLAYDEDAATGVYKLRTYYLSNSHGVWRYLPSTIMQSKINENVLNLWKDEIPETELSNSDLELLEEGSMDWIIDDILAKITNEKIKSKLQSSREDAIQHFVKGYREQSVTLPAGLQKGLFDILKHNNPIELDEATAGLVFAGTTPEIRHFIGVEEGSFYLDVKKLPIRIAGLNQFVPEDLTFENSLNAPEFKYLLDSYEFVSQLYGKVNAEVFKSKDGQFIYTFLRTFDQGKVKYWIGGIETSTKIVGLGLRERWIEDNALMTPLYEYFDQGKGYAGAQHPADPNYYDMYDNFLSKVQVIQEYKHNVEQRLGYLSITKQAALKSSESSLVRSVNRAWVETNLRSAGIIDNRVIGIVTELEDNMFEGVQYDEAILRDELENAGMENAERLAKKIMFVVRSGSLAVVEEEPTKPQNIEAFNRMKKDLGEILSDDDVAEAAKNSKLAQEVSKPINALEYLLERG